MRILVATDAWRPQVNGVVNTYERLLEHAPQLDIELELVHPGRFPTLPCPTYPQIRLSLLTWRAIQKAVQRFEPKYIHVATEGPIGLAARRYCLLARRPFTTSYHTRFPEYLAARCPVPLKWAYGFERWFHNAGCGMLVVAASLGRELEQRGFRNILPWSRGVDTELFRPRPIRRFGSEPVFLYVGRVAVEKNIDAFLKLRVPGKKVVVGDGPQLPQLQQAHPDVIFCGSKRGEALAECYASADVLVFPSLTDTFGNVMLEALASGVPVAAYPVTGPVDLVNDGVVGFLDTDLEVAATKALTVDRGQCRQYASTFTWRRCAELF